MASWGLIMKEGTDLASTEVDSKTPVVYTRSRISLYSKVWESCRRSVNIFEIQFLVLLSAKENNGFLPWMHGIFTSYNGAW